MPTGWVMTRSWCSSSVRRPGDLDYYRVMRDERIGSLRRPNSVLTVCSGILLLWLCQLTAAGMPGIWPMPHHLTRDNRVVRDRLHSRNNPDGADYAFLNAVGAVWPEDIDRAAAGSSASSGFLIDRCHVLTNMHVVYPNDVVVNPELGKKVEFAVGQTEPGPVRGALLGLRLLRNGMVVAHGEAVVLDRVVYRPEEDWALIKLTADVDDAITPLSLAAIDHTQLPNGRQVAAAGFPADHRLHNGDGFNFKDLWGSDGEVVGVTETSTGAAVIQTTLQVTRGSSGGPLYMDVDGRQHLVIGMVQGFSGNGIDESVSAPSRQLLFTPGTLARIGAAEAASACGGTSMIRHSPDRVSVEPSQ